MPAMQAQQNLFVTVDSPPFTECPGTAARLTVRVAASNGQVISNLAKANFRLFDGTNPKDFEVQLRQEASQTSLVILLDQSGSIGDAIGNVRMAAQRLVQQLPDGVELSMIGFNSQFFRYGDLWTKDRQAAIRNLEGVRTSSGGTRLYDAIVEGSLMLRARPGRHAIVVMSDGQDTESTNSIGQAIAAAQGTSSPVFTMGHGDEYNNLEFRQTLSRIAYETGGFPFGSAQASDLARWADLVAPQVVTLYDITFDSTRAGIPVSLYRLIVERAGQTGEVSFLVNGCSPNIILTADPNPILLNPGETTGTTRIRWQTSPPLGTADRVHLRSWTYDGPVIGNTSRLPNGELTLTGVPDGARLFLQFIGPDGKSDTRNRSLASVLIGARGPSAPNPGPVPPESPGPATIRVAPLNACSGAVASIAWTNPQRTPVQIRIGSASGSAMTGLMTAAGGTELSGAWASDGMDFVLVDDAGRELARDTARGTNCQATPPAPQAEFRLSIDPLPRCSGAVATIRWSASQAAPGMVIRVGSPDGSVMTGALNSTSGVETTGAWTDDGMAFYLVHPSRGVLASATARGNNCGGPPPPQGPAIYTISADPLPSCSGAIATLRWQASPFQPGMVIRVGSATGNVMTGELSGTSGVERTGAWATDGMTFWLTSPAGTFGSVTARGPGCNASPQITSLDAPSFVASGDLADVSYSTAGAVSVELRDVRGSILGRSGSASGVFSFPVLQGLDLQLFAYGPNQVPQVRSFRIDSGNRVCSAYTPPGFDGRSLPLAFRNDGNTPVDVRIYHPQFPQRPQSVVSVGAGENVWLIAPPFGAGSDWGIRVGSFCPRPVGSSTLYYPGQNWQGTGSAVRDLH